MGKMLRWFLILGAIGAGAFGWFGKDVPETTALIRGAVLGEPPADDPDADGVASGSEAGADEPGLGPVLPDTPTPSEGEDAPSQHGEGLLGEARELLDDGALAEGAFLLRSFLRRFPASRHRSRVESALDRMRDAWLAEARRLDDLEARDRARDAYSTAYFAARDAETRDAIRERLDELTDRLVFSSRPSPDAIMYTVQPGDSLGKIARDHGVTVESIRRINGLSGDVIRPSQRLKIVPGRWEIFISKTTFELVVLRDGVYVRSYRVGVGKDGLTPEGEFTIATRIPEPSWTKDGEEIPYGDPRNILGTRWLGFDNTETYSGYGIHGTPFAEGIGEEVSAGCIRMRNEDVEEVFDVVPTGTRVIIVR